MLFVFSEINPLLFLKLISPENEKPLAPGGRVVDDEAEHSHDAPSIPETKFVP